MDLPILTLYIANGSGLNAISAYTMELLGILTALSILSHMDTDCTIYSDCQSAINKLTKLQSSTTALRASAPDAALLAASLQHLQQRGKLKWIKAHPERTQKDETLWTREMWGNHLADRAASGSLISKLSYQYNNDSIYILTLIPIPFQYAPELSSQLCPPDFWYFGTINGQLTSKSLVESVHEQRLIRYLADRDESRKNNWQLPPKWQFYNFQLASQLWQLSTNASSRELRNRILLDKHWHGRNQAKSITDDPALHAQILRCPLCLEDDSAEHWTTKCQHPLANTIRNNTITLIKSAINTSKLQLPEHANLIQYFGTDYLSFADPSSTNFSPEVWRGLWTTSQLDYFRRDTSTHYFPYTCIKTLKKLFLQLGRILTNSCTLIWKSRQTTVTALANHMNANPHPDYTYPLHLYPPNDEEDPNPLTEQQLDNIRATVITTSHTIVPQPSYTPRRRCLNTTTAPTTDTIQPPISQTTPRTQNNNLVSAALPLPQKMTPHFPTSDIPPPTKYTTPHTGPLSHTPPAIMHPHPLPPPSTPTNLISSFFSLDHSTPMAKHKKNLHGNKGSRRGPYTKDPHKKDDFSHIPYMELPVLHHSSQRRIASTYIQTTPRNKTTTTNLQTPSALTPHTSPPTASKHSSTTSTTTPPKLTTRTTPIHITNPPNLSKQKTSTQIFMPPPPPRIPRTHTLPTSNHCMQQLPLTLPFSHPLSSSTLRIPTLSDKITDNSQTIVTPYALSYLNEEPPMYIPITIPAQGSDDTDYIYIHRTPFARLAALLPDPSPLEEAELSNALTSHYNGAITIRDTPTQTTVKYADPAQPEDEEPQFISLPRDRSTLSSIISQLNDEHTNDHNSTYRTSHRNKYSPIHVEDQPTTLHARTTSANNHNDHLIAPSTTSKASTEENTITEDLSLLYPHSSYYSTTHEDDDLPFTNEEINILLHYPLRDYCHSSNTTPQEDKEPTPHTEDQPLLYSHSSYTSNNLTPTPTTYSKQKDALKTMKQPQRKKHTSANTNTTDTIHAKAKKQKKTFPQHRPPFATKPTQPPGTQQDHIDASPPSDQDCTKTQGPLSTFHSARRTFKPG